MADGHYHFDDQKRHGRLLRAALLKLEEGRNEVAAITASMIQMKDGDGNDPSHFASHVELFGFSGDGDGTNATAEAKAALAELESMVGALDGIKATLNQGFAKLR